MKFVIALCMFIYATPFLCAEDLPFDADSNEQKLELLDKVQRLHQENQERIFSWHGEAVVKKSRSKFQVDFGTDATKGFDFFYSRDLILNDETKEEFGNWKRGLIRHSTKFYSLSEELGEDVINIRSYSVSSEALTEATFQPRQAFIVMGVTPERLFSRFKRNINKKWFRLSVKQLGEEILVSYGNNSINVADTELTFSLAKGGNLIKCINPGPDFSISKVLDYENIAGAWVPKVVNRKTTRHEEDWSSIQFQNQQVNICKPDSYFEINRVFQLDPKTKILDHTSHQVFELANDTETEFERNNKKSISPGQRISLILLSLVTLAYFTIQNSTTRSIFQKTSELVLANRKQLAILVGFVGLVSVPIFSVLNNESNMASSSILDEERALYCGHWSIYKLGRMLGKDVSQKGISQFLAIRDRGNSLLELKNAVDQLGLHATGRRKESYSDLNNEDLPCIVHLSSPDHYIVLFAGEDDQICSLDGASVRRSLTPQEIENRWTGNFLTVSLAANTEAGGTESAVTFDSLWKDVGNIHQLQSINKVFSFTNNGTANLQIKDVHTSCDCLDTKFSTELVKPGEFATIGLTFNPGKKAEANGDFSHTAFVEFKEGRVFELKISGRIEKEFYTPVELADFGSVNTDNPNRLVLPFYFNNINYMDDLPIIESLSPNAISARWRKDLALPKGRSIPLEISVAQDVDESDVATAIALKSSGSSYSFKIPVRAAIKPQIEPHPRNVVLNPIDPPGTCKVKLVSRNDFNVSAKETADYIFTGKYQSNGCFISELEIKADPDQRIRDINLSVQQEGLTRLVPLSIHMESYQKPAM